MAKGIQARWGFVSLFALFLALGLFNTRVYADVTEATLIMMGDLHGTLVSHAAVIKDPADGTEIEVDTAGGLARLKTVVDGIREEHENAALLSVGDLTHGSAEALFTVGDAMMAVMNQFDIDVFTPGNWDFAYGPAVFRSRYTKFVSPPPPPPPVKDPVSPRPPIPANIQVMADYIDCTGIPNCMEVNDVIRAEFPSVAINLYNEEPPLPGPLKSKRVLPPYKILDKDGVIGITAAIVPQQADVFNIGLRFTQGVEELPGIIAAAQSEAECGGNCLIVVQSELGLSQNLKIARSFDDIDVMYSAHTHEITLGALLADKEGVTVTDAGTTDNAVTSGQTIVVETNRDMYVGQLDLNLTAAGDDVMSFTWQAIPVVADGVNGIDGVDEDEDIAALVALIEEDFVAGEDGMVKRHTFMPGGYCTPPSPADCGDTTVRGHQLVDDLDTVVGYTDTLLLRHHVLEDTLNNFLADAVQSVTSAVVAKDQPSKWGGVDVSMSNGFRFGNAVLADSEITLRDLYTWFPIGPAVNVAEFSGQALEKSMNEILGAVFHRNVFEQRGGWYLGLANMTQQLDLANRPFSSSGGRIVKTMVGDTELDPSKRYIFASCYAQGDAIDQVCRTGGGSGHMFFELKDADDYSSKIKLVSPVSDLNIISGTTIKQVAPDSFLHPVHILRRYLDQIGTVTEADYGVGRVETVNSTAPGNPVAPEGDQIGQPDNTADPGFVQPTYGAGPKFFSGILGQ
jgi:sulfur-oxidizing protein SoxB